MHVWTDTTGLWETKRDDDSCHRNYNFANSTKTNIQRLDPRSRNVNFYTDWSERVRFAGLLLLNEAEAFTEPNIKKQSESSGTWCGESMRAFRTDNQVIGKVKHVYDLKRNA